MVPKPVRFSKRTHAPLSQFYYEINCSLCYSSLTCLWSWCWELMVTHSIIHVFCKFCIGKKPWIPQYPFFSCWFCIQWCHWFSQFSEYRMWLWNLSSITEIKKSNRQRRWGFCLGRFEQSLAALKSRSQ